MKSGLLSLFWELREKKVNKNLGKVVFSSKEVDQLKKKNCESIQLADAIRAIEWTSNPKQSSPKLSYSTLHSIETFGLRENEMLTTCLIKGRL